MQQAPCFPVIGTLVCGRARRLRLAPPRWRPAPPSPFRPATARQPDIFDQLSTSEPTRAGEAPREQRASEDGIFQQNRQLFAERGPCEHAGQQVRVGVGCAAAAACASSPHARLPAAVGTGAGSPRPSLPAASSIEGGGGWSRRPGPRASPPPPPPSPPPPPLPLTASLRRRPAAALFSALPSAVAPWWRRWPRSRRSARSSWASTRPSFSRCSRRR